MENKRYIDKVIEHLVRGTKIDNENDLIYFPWLPFPLGFVDLKSYFDSKDPYNGRPNFHNYCTNTFGLSSDEMKFVHDKLNFIFKDKLKNLYDLPISRFNLLNESIENKKYLDKVIEHLVRDTKMDYENGVIYLLHIPILAWSSLDYTLHSDFKHAFFDFKKYCKNTFGLTEEENIFVWREYKDIILDKIEDGQ